MKPRPLQSKRTVPPEAVEQPEAAHLPEAVEQPEAAHLPEVVEQLEAAHLPEEVLVVEILRVVTQPEGEHRPTETKPM